MASPLSPGRRERRKAETRQRILDAARALFVEQGYDATRPQDIARRADVGAGTFYVHFADKQAAFLAFSEQVTSGLLAAMGEQAARARGFEDGLYQSLEALFEYSEANPGVLGAVSADAAVAAADLPDGTSLRDRLADALAQSMIEAVKDGELPSDYDPLLVAHGLVGFIHNVLVHAAARGYEREQVMTNLKKFLGRALSTTGKGIAK